MPEVFTITATPAKIRFQRDGFCILSCQCKPHSSIGSSKYISVKGHVIGEPESLLGQEVLFTGTLEKNDYGFTVSFTNYTINEAVDYFWTNVSGVSKKSLAELFKRFGRSPNWLDDADYAAKLSSISGIKAKTVRKVMGRWAEYQGVRKLIEQLAPYDVSQRQVGAIYHHFGDRAAKVLSENPYLLTEVSGIGFQTADAIARKLGVDEYSEVRKLAAIAFTMEQLAKDGHTAAHIEAIFNALNEVLIMSSGLLAFSTLEEFRCFVSDSVESQGLMLFDMLGDGNWFAHHKYYMMDSYISEALTALKSTKSNHATLLAPQAVMALSEAESKSAFPLGEQQREAIYLTLTTPGAVAIVGYAGTGKSTVSKIVLNTLTEKCNIARKDVICCALSGVATDRIKNQSGFNAETIHSLLGYNGQGFSYDENNKLPYKIVLLDEAGMVDTWLMYSLLKVIDFKRTKLVMLGDPAQVMPVGAGQPLIDILNNGLVKYKELTQIFRQSDDKAIPVIAQSIRNAEVPEILSSYSDVKFTCVESARGSDRKVLNEQVLNKVLDAALTKRWVKGLPKADAELWEYITQFQVITPRKSGMLGAADLSSNIRTRMLPSTTSAVVFRDSYPMTFYDKVIHLKNANMMTEEEQGAEPKEVRVYNGQLGVVVNVDPKEETVTVRYPLNHYSITYDKKDIQSGLLSYSWALTIHKTQGAEFESVAIPLTMSHFMMLNNKLFYTAVTRAKSDLQLIGEKRALQYAATNNTSIKRVTALRLFRKKT